MRDITKRDLLSHSKALISKEYSAEELVRAYLTKIDAENNNFNAFISVCHDSAIEDARRSDKRRAAGEPLSDLDGIPIAIKDNICTESIKTTCASKILSNYIPPYDATVIKRLKSAGAIIIGKTNMDEFAMGSTGENSYFGVIRNPLNNDRSAGGSSGGSAAAVAAELVPIALGSDTGGSVRQPASFCGIVGMKPTYGRVSRYGLVAFAPSLEQIGILSKSIRDNSAILNIISGHDKRDSMSLDLSKEDFSPKEISLKGLKFAFPKELLGETISKAILTKILRAADLLSDAGAEITEISIPSLKYAAEAYYVISSAEASSNLARFDGVRYGERSESFSNLDELYKNSRSEGFGKEVKRRIMLGTFVLSAGYREEYYKRATRVRENIKSELKKAFETCDILLSPTVPIAPYQLNTERKSAADIYSDDTCTVIANLSALPALSLPCGVDEDLMPVGIQLMGNMFSEKLLYSAAAELKRVLEVRNEK